MSGSVISGHDGTFSLGPCERIVCVLRQILLYMIMLIGMVCVFYDALVFLTALQGVDNSC